MNINLEAINSPDIHNRVTFEVNFRARVPASRDQDKIANKSTPYSLGGKLLPVPARDTLAITVTKGDPSCQIV
ncbi:hypothetical protein PTE30175_01784 [Pandoraea terrae]|uniref:Uncharacterized protein n=1 Tax=Pandoraea terrae TaxID=1537710 RepID=A0A5E4U673_9BURK|nr:hypothetical protein PTE30175_01784 [Pandoraea terrae]